MAGDWIKMRTALANDPAVIAIALDLDKSEFEVVGMLHHLWSWADSQSQDGHIKRVTEKWIDRYVHHSGFAKSMCDAGWLILEIDGITFPNFDRHNGESAKKRAEAAERQRISRANKAAENVTDQSQDSCDKSVTREEKRREDQKPLKAPPTPKAGKADDESFLIFWKLYPKKKSRKDAVRAWAKIKPSQIPMIMESLALHAASHDWLKNNGQYVPLAASWLNGEKFYDEVITYEQSTNRQGAGPAGISLVDQVRLNNQQRQAERARAAGQDPAQSAELFAAGMGESGSCFEGDFSRICDADGKIMGVDD